MKYLFIIHGFYKSGLQLVAESLRNGGAEITAWGNSDMRKKQFAGQVFDGSQLKELLNSYCNETHDKPRFILSHKEPYSLNTSETVFGCSIINMIVYRPLEQVVDSITRQRIKDIYLNKKAIGRVLAMRKFQKSLPKLQLSIKEQFTDYYGSVMQQLNSGNLPFFIVNAGDYEASMATCVQAINNITKQKLDATRSVDLYDSDKFTLQKAIDKYRDGKLNEIKVFFTQTNKV